MLPIAASNSSVKQSSIDIAIINTKTSAADHSHHQSSHPPPFMNALYPLYTNSSITNSSISSDTISAWHTSVLPHYHHTPFSVYYIFLLIALAFLLLYQLVRLCHNVLLPMAVKNDKNRTSYVSSYLNMYHALPETAQIEWNSYIVSSIHASLACIAGIITMLHSYHSFHIHYLTDAAHIYSSTTSSLSILEPTLIQSISFFFNTSMHPYHTYHTSSSPSSLSSSSSSSTSAAAALSLALDCTFSESYLRDCMLMITCGYLLYDLIFCIYYALTATTPSPAFTSPLVFLHHILILAAFIYGIYHHIGTFYMSTFLLNEFSTLFLNINFFLAASHLPTLSPYAQYLYILNAVSLLWWFFFFRIVGNLYWLAHIFAFSWYELYLLWASDSVWQMNASIRIQCALLSILAMGHCIINLLWFGKLIRAVMRKVSKPAGAAVASATADKQKEQ